MENVLEEIRPVIVKTFMKWDTLLMRILITPGAVDNL